MWIVTIAVAGIAAAVALIAWQKRQTVQNGTWHEFESLKGFMMRRFREGKWEYRPLTSQEMLDFFKSDNRRR
jgi:hypothetical protein